MRSHRRSKGRRLLVLSIFVIVFLWAFLVSGGASGGSEPGFFRRVGRKIKALFRGRQTEKREAPAVTQASLPAPVVAPPLTLATTNAGHPQQQVSVVSDARHGQVDSQVTDSAHTYVRGRQPPADPAKVVWQSLALPHYRTGKVQEVLEYWHMEAATHLLDASHLQELLRSYITVLDWAGKVLLPDVDDTLRSFTSVITSTVLDVAVCSKRLVYLSGVPIVSTRNSESSDINLRKTKAVHTLGVFYVLQGRLVHLASLIRESGKLLCKELVKQHNFRAHVKVLMPFTRLGRYSLDSLDYLIQYYRELRAAIIGATVYPLMVTRTYTHLHNSLQTAGQFFATCIHARKIGASLQHDISELRGVGGTAAWGSTSQWANAGAGINDALVLSQSHSTESLPDAVSDLNADQRGDQ